MAIKKSKNSFFLQDVSIILFSVLIAIILVKTGVLSRILLSTEEYEILGSFIVGMFFTSVFTTAPAIAALGEVAQVHGMFQTAFIGALGSILGDLIIFRFVKDRFSEHVNELLAHKGVFRRFRALFRLRFFRWFTFLIGGIVIASPLPDEIGITLLGYSKMKTSYFVGLSFVFNFLGILFIGWAEQNF